MSCPDHARSRNRAGWCWSCPREHCWGGCGDTPGTALCDRSSAAWDGAPGSPSWSLAIQAWCRVCEVLDEGHQEVRGLGLAGSPSTSGLLSQTGADNRSSSWVCRGTFMEQRLLGSARSAGFSLNRSSVLPGFVSASPGAFCSAQAAPPACWKQLSFQN